MELTIEVDHTLELPIEVDGNQEIVPVVAYGQPIKGKVILSTKKGTAKTSFSGLELTLRSTAYFIQENMDMPSEDFELGDGPVVVPLVLETAKTYELEGELEVPFEVPARALPACDGYWGKGLFVKHELEVKTAGGRIRSGASGSLTLGVQMLGATPKSSGSAWMTVADHGGNCK